MKIVIASLLLLVGARVVGAQGVPIPMVVPDRPYEVTVSQRETDMEKLLKPPALSESALKGRRLWVQRCALCHDGVGTPTYETMGPRLDAARVKKLGDSRVRQQINEGSRRMPGFQYGLAAEQVDALLSFLKTVTPDQMAPIAAGRAKGGRDSGL